MDRVRATRLAVRCMRWLEDTALNGKTRTEADSRVIGIKGRPPLFFSS